MNTAFTLGSHSGNGASDATVNLTGGTFTSNTDIVDGGGSTTSTINLSGGSLDMAGNVIGTFADLIGLTAECGTLQNVGSINGTGGLTKTTAGTLALTGTNIYAGDTVVSEGILNFDDDGVQNGVEFFMNAPAGELTYELTGGAPRFVRLQVNPN